MLVDLVLGHQSAAHRLGDGGIGIAKAALHIGAGPRAYDGGMDGIGGGLMRRIEIGDSPAVADHEIGEAPLLAQNLLQQAL